MSDDPAYLVVWAHVTDPVKFKAYSQALAASGLYEKFQGYYSGFGKPAELLEGEWPQNRSLVLARFPNRDAALAFWRSDIYSQQIKPIREGGGEVVAAIFDELPSPDRINWA